MPYPNEHACRIEDPGKFKHDSFRRVKRKSASHGGKEYDVIRGRTKADDKWADQAYRYDKGRWSKEEAGDHCRAHKGNFEAASGGQSRKGATLRDQWSRTPLSRGIEEGLAGVDTDNQVIRGYSVVTRGEVHGHGVWLDETALNRIVELGNANPQGMKTRFTHPGLSSDGLGSFLGRSKNFRRRGGVALADLHISEMADRSPRGPLGEYVLGLAHEDPDAFGASAVIKRDRKAEMAFMDEHRDDDGAFVSPDPGNVGNLPHTVVVAMRAADIVDEPAANEGLFPQTEMGALAMAADQWLDVGFRLTDELPMDTELLQGAEIERVQEYFDRWLARRGLEITEVGMAPAHSEGPSREDRDMGEDISAATARSAEEIAALREEGQKAERERFARLEEKFGERPDFVMKQFAAGHDVAEADVALKDVLLAEQAEEIKRLKAEAEEKAGTSAVLHGEGQSADSSPLAAFEQKVTEYMASHPQMIRADAWIECSKLYPELADKVCMPAGVSERT